MKYFFKRVLHNVYYITLLWYFVFVHCSARNLWIRSVKEIYIESEKITPTDAHAIARYPYLYVFTRIIILKPELIRHGVYFSPLCASSVTSLHKFTNSSLHKQWAESYFLIIEPQISYVYSSLFTCFALWYKQNNINLELVFFF